MESLFLKGPLKSEVEEAILEQIRETTKNGMKQIMIGQQRSFHRFVVILLDK